MLKQNLILQTMNLTDHFRKEKIKKILGLMKDKLGGKIKEFVEMRAKSYSCLIDDTRGD